MVVLQSLASPVGLGSLLLQSLPLLVALLALLVVSVSRVSDRVDVLLTRAAILLFGGFTVAETRRQRRRANLRAGHLPVTYREYAARTRLASVVNGIVGGVVAVYAVWVLFLLFVDGSVGGRLPASLTRVAAAFDLSVPVELEQFVYSLVVGLVVGLGVALATYGYRWYYPRFLADERARQIDFSLPMTVSFMYALSRSGMSFPEVMRILARNDHVYGQAAREVRVAVRNIDVFGVDVVTAVETMGRRSPSRNFRELSENLASVLRTGGSLSEYLENEYREFRQEAELQQERLLTDLATYAEAYAALGIAGPLFLIVILLIFALAIPDVPLLVARVVVYGLIPFFNIAAIVYLTSVVESFSQADLTDEELAVNVAPKGVRRRADLEGERTPGEDRASLPTPDGGTAPDGGTGSAVGPDTERVRENRRRLASYRRLEEVRKRLGSPVGTVLREPTALLWVTVPLAILVLGLRIPGLLADRVVTIREFDDLVIQSLLLVVGSFAVVYEIHRRRIRAIESVIPDFLDRLASLNEAGMTVVASMDRIRRSELGRLNDELDIIWRDIQWGADLATALKRFEARVRTTTISRTVTLLTESMRASGDVGPVLRIAANRAKADRRLKRRRRDEMVVYNIFIYIGFLVFLGIIGVVIVVLLPQLPDAPALSAEQARRVAISGNLQGLGQIDEDAWTLTLIHAIILQGFFSGWLAGQFSTGDLRAGAKHVTVLVALGYVTVLLIL